VQQFRRLIGNRQEPVADVSRTGGRKRDSDPDPELQGVDGEGRHDGAGRHRWDGQQLAHQCRLGEHGLGLGRGAASVGQRDRERRGGRAGADAWERCDDGRRSLGRSVAGRRLGAAAQSSRQQPMPVDDQPRRRLGIEVDRPGAEAGRLRNRQGMRPQLFVTEELIGRRAQIRRAATAQADRFVLFGDVGSGASRQNAAVLLAATCATAGRDSRATTAVPITAGQSNRRRRSMRREHSTPKYYRRTRSMPCTHTLAPWSRPWSCQRRVHRRSRRA
jgi:hypothetical protein